MKPVISFEQKGDYSKTLMWLRRVAHAAGYGLLDTYGKEGVRLLQEVTPKDTGETADSWRYEAVISNSEMRLEFYNDNLNKGIPIVILIDQGHATVNGLFVEGRNFISPTLKPLFDELADKVWKEVTKD